MNTSKKNGRREILLQKASEERPEEITRQNWFTRNLELIKTSMRVLFGIIWAIDGAIKLQPGFIGAFPSVVEAVSTGQPAFLHEWFSFWNSLTLANPAMFVYGEATIELVLGGVLILGLFRKVAYIGGFFLSLLIWSVGEGFGGPYSAASTDIGAGIIYAVGFLFLILVNATYGPSKHSLDRVIEQKWATWRRVAEIRAE
jgi:nitrite reductase (NO-forming)